VGVVVLDRDEGGGRRDEFFGKLCAEIVRMEVMGYYLRFD